MANNKPKSAMASLLDFASDNPVASKIDKPVTQTYEYNIQQEEGDNKNINTANEIIELSPSDCVLWQFADRPQEELGDISQLAQSMKMHGQQEPALVRPASSGKYKYEIIFGNRRWRAAAQVDIKLLAVVKELNDKEAARCQKEENENRQHLSDYARALSYRSQIDSGVFSTEKELAQYLGISKQTLNDIMAYLRVPAEIRESISNFRYLSKSMVIKLAFLAKKKENIIKISKLGLKISEGKVTTGNIEKLLDGDDKECTTPHDGSTLHLEKNHSGEVLFKAKKKSNRRVVIEFFDKAISNKSLDDLYKKIRYLIDNLNGDG